ncbi:uncharacterized protein LOC112270071 [Brachypodium distachyon]|uniref:DUF4283 domain-containing protein n=1 Tax=Brachypodium distachyon TaxID=15368 RepID=A0A2K2DRF6_BRADI|nr:uncharacterized protein LOC112270071 [Brachypodium distachyon]PNT76853.1 hypothetical protein BRADI_1g54790v3 [Brachypodium distachyon]|eukprot:XP_024313498.1 uncharacterized protein LOC112270071 [Brachypodium distachyon]
MLMNYPLECWDIEAVSDAFVPYGRFLVWNKEISNRARIIVKIRVYDVQALPLSLVILNNTNDIGNGDSWTCPLFVLSYNILGTLPADEDPLPPNGETPHPMPVHFHDVWSEPGHVQPQPPFVAQVFAVEDDIIHMNVQDGDDEAFEPVHTVNLQHNNPHDVAVQQLDDEPPLELQPGAIPVEPVVALQNMEAEIMSNANDILPKLLGADILGANCKVVDEQSGTKKKCFFRSKQLLNISPLPAVW